MPRHFLSTMAYSRAQLVALLEDAARLKAGAPADDLRGKTVGLLFFNSSLRTRSSFEIGVHQLGGKAIVLEPGRGSWPIAFERGEVMDGDEEEHLIEVARVLSRYCDVLGVRAFPKFVDWHSDRRDPILNTVAEFATVPVINLETITHPCQELALALTMQEHLGQLEKKKFLLTWTYHPKPLNTAVANSALLIATKMGMDVTVLSPTPEYALDSRYMCAAEAYAKANGNRVTVTHDIESAYAGADFVYAKSWGALPYFGRWDVEKPIRDAHRHFIVDEQKMSLTAGAKFSHCLPVRRNVKVTDGVLDSPACVAIDEAENRLHVQKAIMRALVDPAQVFNG